MSSAAVVFASPQVTRSPGHTTIIYLKEAKYEFLKNLRLRLYTASVLSFPLMFYVLFGLVLNPKEAIAGTSVPTYLIATYGTFGVMGASLFGTAAGLASDRGLGWLQVKRAGPMPPFAYFIAKVVVSMIFSGIVVLALILLGFAFGGVRFPLGDPIFRHGLSHRLLRRTAISARHHQLNLSAHVVLQRALGAIHVSAKNCAANRAGDAALSSLATGAGHRWCRQA
jgi:hypothetical protein